jgi:hypothetical protein
MLRSTDCAVSRRMTLLVTRRHLLMGLPAVGASLLCSTPLTAQTLQSGCSITAADSLLYYALLLQQVKSDAISAGAKLVIEQLVDCSDLLVKLKSQLQLLNQRLNSKGQTKGVSEGLRNYGKKLEAILSPINEHRTLAADSAVMVMLSADGNAIQEVLLAASEECDPDPDGETRKLIREILEVIRTQNLKLEQYQTAHDLWQTQVSAISKQIDNLQSELDDAGVAIANAPGTGPYVTSSSANQHLERAITGLKEVIGQSSARDALVGLIMSIQTMLTHTNRPMNASFSSAVYNFDDDSLEPLTSRVSRVVHNSNYFVPGSFLQSMACLAICFPVWVSYPNDKSTKVQLIRAAVQFIHGIKSDKVNDVAQLLAGISVGSTVS